MKLRIPALLAVVTVGCSSPPSPDVADVTDVATTSDVADASVTNDTATDVAADTVDDAPVVCELVRDDGGVYCRMENVPPFRTCFLQSMCLQFDAGGGPCCELLA